MAVKRQIVWGVASLATLYIGVANALGLGELKLDSALNQPLDATIFLQGGGDVDPSDIRVSLADAAAFRNAGLERPHFLTELRFTPTMENNQLVVRVQSPGPVREPYLNFLVELRRPNGRLLREYTLLLDPPLYQPPSAPQPRSFPAPAGNPVQQGRAVDAAPRAPAAPRPAAAPAALPDLAPAAGARQYRTAAGDSLWGIASRARPGESVSIEETMLAIRALNPDAFIDGDPSRLRVGQVLTLPTAEQLGAAGEAPVPETASDGSLSQERAAAPLIAPRPAATTDSRSGMDAQTGSAAAAGSRSEPAVTDAEPTARLRIEEEQRSERVSADAALLADRLRSLEARFNVMLDELDARDRQIASLQAELEILRQAQQAESDQGEGSAASAAGPTLSDAQDAEGPVSTTGSEEPEPGAVDAEVLPAVAEAPEPAQPADGEGSTVPEAQEQGLISRWWPALLALLAVLLGLVFFARKRADDQDDPEEEERVMPAQPTRVAPEAAAPLAAAMAADSATQRPTAVRAAPKPVDPLDGVELYITYGRFAEARAMLDKAIVEQPNRLDLRYKQLRVLAELGESRAFTAQEQNVLAQGGDAGRIEQIKARFPALFAATDAGLVEQVDHVEPMLAEETTPEADEQAERERAEDITATQLNLNDFTLDPDWDLIEGLTPSAPRKDNETAFGAADERFESSLHEFPEIEELDDEHNEHFPGMRRDDKPRSEDR
ncbi:LysM peptidoglycan-binding domain-containing protein [Halopseudomonas nanhaiensis]|uniref:type IV pilus assembly protein FimV n=1 Tax=Halopseudomonas nanhaiensis TaxID=2830842 RepID=UPI001CBD3F2C|nr:FimV/HubP family polar landmark protein [Halopseudomonas nanhaiensis]UAW99753.1 LysM peptidoglycan-binding domain-containing protein [Halopseudomonas nanhaiensis]